MIDTLTFCFLTSLKITAIYVCCWHGNILFPIRNRVGGLLYRYHLSILSKPLFECLPCMASVYGFLFWFLNGGQYNLVEIVIIVCGMLAIIDSFINVNNNEGCVNE